MQAIYLEYGRSRTFGDKSKGGLLSSFLKEYRIEFGVSVTPGCNSCLTKYWNNYTNLFIMKAENTCSFKLKQKYNGIWMKGYNKPIRNGDMTNELALQLLQKHPAGEKLFDVIPEYEALAEIDSKDDLEPLEELSLKELRNLHPEIKARSTEDFLKQLEDKE